MRRIGFSLRDRAPTVQSPTLQDRAHLARVQVGTPQETARRFQAARPRDKVDISMVIPAYNEEQRILPTLLSVTDYLSRRAGAYEVIVVDDGSDDQTAQVVHELSKCRDSIHLIRLACNMGKGAAVRTGIRRATGHFIIYNDADGATPIGEIERLLAAMEKGADVAIGSRALPSRETHVERKLQRAVPGRIFALLVRILIVPGIADTQCGFKMFRRHVAQRIFEIQRLDGFAFDIEVLQIALTLGYHVVEIPVNWNDVKGSKVSMLKDSLRMLYDVFRVCYSLKATSSGR